MAPGGGYCRIQKIWEFGFVWIRILEAVAGGLGRNVCYDFCPSVSAVERGAGAGVG